MFGKKSRLERETDALEERIDSLQKTIDWMDAINKDLHLRYLRNLREYRYTQKSCERRKRANKRLRAMLDDVGWPKNDNRPNFEKWKGHPAGERPVVLDEDGKPKRLVPRRLP